MIIRHKVWLENEGRVLFGEGRYELLKTVAECKSLNAAAKKLNMSYRAAWGRLKASEERLGIPLVVIESQKQGMHLTEQATALLEAFDQLEAEISSLIAERTKQLSFLCTPENDKKPEYSKRK
ncbi:MAG: chromosome replication initiation inhibitor protein [Syntrophus sp. PtaU1.Bin208]|uniref:Molybdate transport system regulatory protein n=1 Tax=Syntrophus gentianae TaxID=43775 RepID=A0A1H8AYS1_9BACT|nr:LysR family transcriptional regulator [Syntrophus gentianae]OPY84535.1 MAG: chromosome replication initiation inhibitor protein [Syntrophus sp. PtaU1.Bin208]SEM75921.1 molybdate transport system regulatory protein [Syntrophus gentianae]